MQPPPPSSCPASAEVCVDERLLIVSDGHWPGYDMSLARPHCLPPWTDGPVEYERIEEDHWSVCDMEVHEHPIVAGSVGLIRSRIDHRDLRGIDSYLRKHNDYAAWEAQRLFSHRHDPLAKARWKPHQRLKYRLITSPWGGLAFFLGSFFIMGGWRDGGVGFAFCLLKAGYFTQIACRLRELEQQHVALPPAG